MQKDAYMRQYMDRDRVFDHRLNILRIMESPKWIATNIKGKGQYISIPAIWRNYYDLIGFRRDCRTKELWLTSKANMEKAFFLSPEGNGIISCKEQDGKKDIKFNIERPMRIDILYIDDNGASSPIVKVNGKRCAYERTGSGYARHLAIRLKKTVGTKGLHISVE